MIYVPDIEHYECFVMNDNYIRGYETGISQVGDYVPYTDFYYNNNYYSKSGIELIEFIPICLPSSKLTTDFYYRVDFYKILIIFLILSIFIIYIPLKLISKIFKRRI